MPSFRPCLVQRLIPGRNVELRLGTYHFLFYIIQLRSPVVLQSLAKTNRRLEVKKQQYRSHKSGDDLRNVFPGMIQGVHPRAE